MYINWTSTINKAQKVELWFSLLAWKAMQITKDCRQWYESYADNKEDHIWKCLQTCAYIQCNIYAYISSFYWLRSLEEIISPKQQTHTEHRPWFLIQFFSKRNQNSLKKCLIMKVPSTKQKQDEPGTSYNTKTQAHAEKQMTGQVKKIQGLIELLTAKATVWATKYKQHLDYKINYKININESMLA